MNLALIFTILKENGRYGKDTESGTGEMATDLRIMEKTRTSTAKSYLDYLNSFGDIGVSAVLGTEYQYTTVETLG